MVVTASATFSCPITTQFGYHLQANAKTLKGSSHPDRNAQFEYIDRKVRRFLRQGQPVISVDTKKKELVGDFKNGGRELRLKETRSRCGSMTSYSRVGTGHSVWRL